MTQNYQKLLQVWVKKPPDVFQNAKTVQQLKQTSIEANIWGGAQNFVTMENYIFLTGNFNSCTSTLQIKTFYLQPPPKRLTAMFWRVK